MGRPKGSPNKIGKTVREMIEQALNKAGGVEYLTTIAQQDPRAFCSLVGKIIPKEITGPGGGAIQMTLERILDEANKKDEDHA